MLAFPHTLLQQNLPRLWKIDNSEKDMETLWLRQRKREADGETDGQMDKKWELKLIFLNMLLKRSVKEYEKPTGSSYLFFIYFYSSLKSWNKEKCWRKLYTVYFLGVIKSNHRIRIQWRWAAKSVNKILDYLAYDLL